MSTNEPAQTNEPNIQNGGCPQEIQNLKTVSENTEKNQEKPGIGNNQNLEVETSGNVINEVGETSEEKKFEEIKQNFLTQTNEQLLDELKKELNNEQIVEVGNILKTIDTSCENLSEMAASGKESRGRSSEHKLPAELRGQPSVEQSLENWKMRESELLHRITLLEKQVEKSEKYEGPLDPVAQQRQLQLELDLNARTKEKEDYKRRLSTIEKELLSKENFQRDEESMSDRSSEDVITTLKTQNDDLRSALTKMTSILRDKSGLCASQEKKISALTDQVDSLKEVVAITKDLLNIRNMEVQHLTSDICKMEAKIDAERERHNLMIVKMDEAVKLNGQLKKEYETQLKLFQQLRDRYEEKMNLMSSLTHQDNCLRDLINSVAEGTGTDRARPPSPSAR